jgi:ABC-type oligopeptide transport system substrate-binding subunit
VGLIAFELFVGRFPYHNANMALLLNDILTRPVDVGSVGLSDKLTSVLERLLAKRREDRYQDAAQVMRDLCAATGCLLPAESVDIRESYLQAARFVGREAELAKLSHALDEATAGQGSAWLVGGESGVGKSRLVEELRALALVKGALVLRGQAVREGGSPYHMWRNVHRWLALSADLTLEEASALKPLVSDIAGLVGFAVPDASPLKPQAAQARLFQVVDQVLRRQEQAMVVILEDLHWARSESLALLNHLAGSLAYSQEPKRLLLLGTYRDEEHARLPEDLAGMHVLKLDRLTKASIIELSVSMLGPAGRRAPVVSLLQRETEGNPFFLVEVVRTLAEEAGQLEQVGRMTLPAYVLAGGVQQLVKRRLERVPPQMLLWLRLAAVYGREVDLDLMSVLQPRADTAAWLSAYQEAAVLEVSDGRWRFAHDKLRQGVLDGVAETEHPGLHAKIAEAIEAVYPGRPDQIARLAYHWAHAGCPERARPYMVQAGDQARLAYAHQEAIDAYRRALAFLDPSKEPARAARIQMKLGLACQAAQDYRAARQAYEEGFALWQQAAQGEPECLPPAPHALRVHSRHPVTLDPTMSTDVGSMDLIQQLFSGLVHVGAELDVMPDVAQSWDILEDARRYVFHLRDDVRWSDGIPVTAGDFGFAWRRMLDPAFGSTSARLLFDVRGARAFNRGEIEWPGVGIEERDERTLVVDLEAPTAHFLQVVSRCYPIPRHKHAALGESWADAEALATNGPFQLASWQKHQSMALEQNPKYHGPCVGNVQYVQITFARGAALLASYENDDLDVLDLQVGLDIADWDRTRHQHAGEFFQIPELASYCVGFDASRAPFDDPRVRRAFALAVDKESFWEIAGTGYFSPALGGLVPPNMPGHSPEIGLPFDPEQARRLLEQAGYAVGKDLLGTKFPPVELLTSRRLENWGRHLAEQWSQNLGIECARSALDWPAYLDRLQKAPPNIFHMGWTADYPDPDSFLRVAVALHTHWRNEKYELLLETARRTTDQGERMEWLRQADRLLIQQAAIVPLSYGGSYWLIKPWVTHFPVAATGYRVLKDVVIEPH